MLRKQLMILGAMAILGTVFAQGCTAEEQAAVEETVATAQTAASPLLDPAGPAMNETAPAVYKALFSTSKGDFTIEVNRAWAPRGADRFYNLVKNGFYNDTRFFRVISGFMVQFGISGDPALNDKWQEARIPDDPVMQTNARGAISFATAGPNTRTTQVFINYGDNGRLDGFGFAPFGTVTEGMDVVDMLYAEYGEGAPQGAGPNQGLIQARGNAYLTSDFPNLDFIRTARLVE
jgi:peptidyl-prolyl cis-trans isomerase A (cyclophilin A)